MRTTLEILIAVKESRPVEFEELRLALVALDSIHHFTGNALNDLIEAVEETPKASWVRAHFAKETRQRMFEALKTDPGIWLGPANIPGNPEHDKYYRMALAVARSAGVL